MVATRPAWPARPGWPSRIAAAGAHGREGNPADGIVSQSSASAASWTQTGARVTASQIASRQAASTFMPVRRTLAARLLRSRSSTRNTEYVGPHAAPRVEMARPSVETRTLLIHAPAMSACIVVPEDEKSGQVSGWPRTSPIVVRVVFILRAESFRVSRLRSPAPAVAGCNLSHVSIVKPAACAGIQRPGG